MKTINRLCLYSICIILIIAFLTPARGASPDKPGITSASIKEKKLKRGKKVTIFKSDLVDSRYAIMEGTAVGGEASVKKVEVSLDNGGTWNEATGKEKWQYKFSPAPNYKYYLTFRVTSVKGVVSSPSAFGTTHLMYLPITLSGLIQQQANELAKAYMSKRLEKYMGLISKDYKNYPRGRHKLRRSIQNDFRSLNNIVLRFTVNQVFKLDKVIMAEIHWTLTHAQLAEPEEGNIEIHFDPADQLKVIVQKKDLYFGEAVIGYNGRIRLEEDSPFVEVTVTDLDMLGAGLVTVRGRGNCDGFPNFNGTIRLTETPPRSGRFFGIATCPLPGGPPFYFTATYIDKITTNWRRNVRRTTRIQ